MLTKCCLNFGQPISVRGIFFGFAPNDSVKYVVYFGDGVSDSAYFQIYSNWLDSIHCELQHDYYFIGNYQPVIKVVWPNFHTDTMSSSIINVTNGCTPISGHIYKDMNGNCTFDSLVDVPFPYMNINANANNPAGNTNFFTNNFGYYSGNLVTGLTYSLTPNFYQNYAADCGTGIVGPFTTNGNLVITDWPIYYTNAPDVSAWVHGGYFRPGLTPFIATTTFYGHTGISAQFQFTDSLELDPQVVYNSTINGNIPDGFNSDKVWWTNSTTICNTSQNNVSTLELSPLAQIGDIVHFKYRINPILNELDTLDNIDESVYVVGNSYDPNYIEPKPIEGIVDTGITIKYMIHFQNTGTDTAYNIFIIDTLDANLEFLSFEILGATHQLSIDYLAGNIIKFNFYNINLIDSGTDLALSQGFVAYKIKVKSNLAIGTQIKNTAFIYFDINPPVKTNTTIHHIGMIDAIVSVNNTNLTLYPNPASNVLNIKLNATQQQYSITDTKGNTLMQNSISKQEQLQIDISTLPSGFYIIGFLNKLGYITREKFVKL